MVHLTVNRLARSFLHTFREPDKYKFFNMQFLSNPGYERSMYSGRRAEHDILVSR